MLPIHDRWVLLKQKEKGKKPKETANPKKEKKRKKGISGKKKERKKGPFRQVAFAMNRESWNRKNSNGKLKKDRPKEEGRELVGRERKGREALYDDCRVTGAKRNPKAHSNERLQGLWNLVAGPEDAARRRRL